MSTKPAPKDPRDVALDLVIHILRQNVNDKIPLAPAGCDNVLRQMTAARYPWIVNQQLGDTKNLPVRDVSHPVFPIGMRIKHDYRGLGYVVGAVRDRFNMPQDMPARFDRNPENIEYVHLDYSKALPQEERAFVVEGDIITKFSVTERSVTERNTSATPAPVRPVAIDPGVYRPILPQAERDDWFTSRIDPYDDRIRVLERFMHGLKSSGTNGT